MYTFKMNQKLQEFIFPILPDDGCIYLCCRTKMLASFQWTEVQFAQTFLYWNWQSLGWAAFPRQHYLYVHNIGHSTGNKSWSTCAVRGLLYLPKITVEFILGTLSMRLLLSSETTSKLTKMSYYPKVMFFNFLIKWLEMHTNVLVLPMNGCKVGQMSSQFTCQWPDDCYY